MISLWIDDKAVEVCEGSSVLQAALSAGIQIAHLCDSRVPESNGWCGLCLVETAGTDELVLACRTTVAEGMKVFTKTPKAVAAVRARAAELFAGHPAACAVCVKAGDCDIQKICAAFQPEIQSVPAAGKKRRLLDWIDVTPQKCIRCGRCAAFLKKAGVARQDETTPPVFCPPFLLSGTLIDLCPSAALTNAAAKKLTRPWETVKTKSIDVTDAVGSAVEMETLQGEIVRVTPAEPGGLISDKARFCLDGLRINRLDRPYARIDGRLKECSWTEAFVTIASKIKSVPPEKTAALIGDFADCESMLALKDLFALTGAKAIDARPDDTMYFDLNSRQSRLFNTPFARIKEADALLSIGARVCDLAPAVGWLLRGNKMPKAFVGGSAVPGYDVLGDSPRVLNDILNGTGSGALMLKRAEKPMIIVGPSVLQRADAAAIMDLVCRICAKYNVIRGDWNGYNFLHGKATLAGALELGLVSPEPLRPKIKNGEFDFVYLLNEDGISRRDLGGAFTVYQGIYASAAAQDADVVLPALAFTEKRATYVNAEGRAQSTAVVSPPFGMAREDWKILRALSEHLGTAPLPYDDLEDIRDYLAGENIIFYNRGEIAAADNVAFGTPGPVSETPLVAGGSIFDDELCRQSEYAAVLKRALSE